MCTSTGRRRGPWANPGSELFDDRSAENCHTRLTTESRAPSELLTREFVVTCVLHAENPGEMTRGPGADDAVQLLRPVGCVHERDVVAVFIQRLGENDGVSLEDSRALLLSEGGYVGLERVERLWTVLLHGTSLTYLPLNPSLQMVILFECHR